MLVPTTTTLIVLFIFLGSIVPWYYNLRSILLCLPLELTEAKREFIASALLKFLWPILSA